MSNERGFIVVIAAPSGAGKTTICREIERRRDDVVYSISVTTRERRMNEKDKIDYYFKTKEEFEEMIREKQFVEWAIVHGNYYGTPKNSIKGLIENDRIVIMDIDVQGARSIRKEFPDSSVLIFVMPSDIKTLKDRLLNRNQDNMDTIRKRLHNAKEEIEKINEFDYIVINNELEKAIDDVDGIINSECLKTFNNEKLIGKFKEDLSNEERIL
ncbi:MAG: guanylate kinase [Proteobacteria bacterium]|nr:guanylate kinase [Pseudomonadota bacterium]